MDTDHSIRLSNLHWRIDVSSSLDSPKMTREGMIIHSFRDKCVPSCDIPNLLLRRIRVPRYISNTHTYWMPAMKRYLNTFITFWLFELGVLRHHFHFPSVVTIAFFELAWTTDLKYWFIGGTLFFLGAWSLFYFLIQTMYKKIILFLPKILFPSRINSFYKCLGIYTFFKYFSEFSRIVTSIFSWVIFHISIALFDLQWTIIKYSRTV